MDKNNARQYIPLLEALADGELQYRPCSDIWEDIKAPDFREPPYYFRRKPKPTVVQWTLETCPVGAVVRNKRNGYRYILTYADDVSTTVAHYGNLSYQCFLDDWTMDNGESCGVVNP
jgi:hypothetical protein